ncbi:MAG: hypothetical protein ACK4ZW_05935 [Blastomonas sp.]
MKHCIPIAAALALAACSTPGGLRQHSALLTADTDKSTVAFTGCVVDLYQDRAHRPTFTPREQGGSLEFTVSTWTSTYTMALIDIADMGDRRRIQLFSKGKGNFKELSQNIRSCL